MLAAAIKSVDTSGFDDVCQSQLVDATGEVFCLLQRDLKDRVGGKNFKAGSVMLLKNVTVFKRCSGDVHVIVTPNNMVSLYWKNLSESEVKVDKFSSLSKDEVLSNAVKYKCEERIHSRILDELEGVETNEVYSQTITQPSEICPQELSSLTEGNFFPRFHSTPTVAS
jgi:hypothetical protein